jgi:hypothetical protein
MLALRPFSRLFRSRLRFGVAVIVGALLSPAAALAVSVSVGKTSQQRLVQVSVSNHRVAER